MPLSSARRCFIERVLSLFAGARKAPIFNPSEM
jgi:hypothetical protein